jgi:hypothetical protein
MSIISQEIEDKLNSFHKTNRIPHIIFHGDSGSGKKTIVFNFIKKIYHYNEANIKNNVMFVNCAHGKGIKFIREELKFFAKTNVHFQNGVFFKIVVLINADYLTVDAQSALRRCIEQFSHSTRFFIVIENKNKLLTPIISRFCEIYIPLVQNENLHKKKVQQNYTFSEHFRTYNHDLISQYMNKYTHVDHVLLLQIVDELYNHGVHSIDFIDWIKNSSTLSELEKSTISMYYSKVRLEYRCEKLLLMCLFDVYFFNKDIHLKTLSFM